MASRTYQLIEGKFSARVNPKDGFAISESKEARARKVPEFLVPLLYSEKPTRIIITVENTIFGALFGERPVDWGAVLKDVVQWLYAGMEKSKAIALCPYIFHLYHTDECLLQGEKKDYQIAEAVLTHNVEPEEEDEPEASEDLERESLSSKEVQEI